MNNLTSCLYECEIRHKRIYPKRHNVHHSMFSFYLDLDELEQIRQEIPLITLNKKGIYALFDSDHFGTETVNLKTKLKNFVSTIAPELSISKIKMITQLRFLNYVFNPLTTYFCFDQKGLLCCAVAEVGNTFGEKKPYLLRANGSTRVLTDSQPKNFYISPFIALDAHLHFRFEVPADTFDLTVTTSEGQQLILVANVTGQRRELNIKTLLQMTCKYPFVSFLTIAGIHLHALLLWLKKIPFIAKESNPQLQTNVLRPHSSLTRKQP